MFRFDYTTLSKEALETELTELKKVSYLKTLLFLLNEPTFWAFLIMVSALDYTSNKSVLHVLLLIGASLAAIVFFVSMYFLDICIRKYRINKALNTKL